MLVSLRSLVFAPPSLGLALAAVVLPACSGAAEPAALSSQAQAAIAAAPLAYDEYSVLFTNPNCRSYEYAKEPPVLTAEGVPLTGKRPGAYCTSADSAAAAAQDGSPQKKLLEWIADPTTREVFFAYLSFSNRAVADALCVAIRERDVKVTMVLDRETDTTVAQRVLACSNASSDPARAPRLELRGHDGTIGFAHNKVFFINPGSEEPRIVFSSGNLSSGLVTHHENWHFVRPKPNTHFARAHVCLMEGMLEHYRTKQEYTGFVKTCRAAIGAPEESDIKSFFVPGQGGDARLSIATELRRATFVGVAAHRFSDSKLRSYLAQRLAAEAPPVLRLVVDDDVYWAGRGLGLGLNTEDERSNVEALATAGADVRYVETNHGANQLHHNKFIVFETATGPSVFAGAGNFTGTAFTDNFENFYFITIPHVATAMAEQHRHLFEDLAVPASMLPAEDTLPGR